MQLLQRSGQRIVCRAAVSRSRLLTRHAERHWGHAAGLKKETPLKGYLRGALSLRDQVLDSITALVPTLRELGPCDVNQIVEQNIQLLGSVAPTHEAVRRVVVSNPGLLTAPLESWLDFFSAYGVEAWQFWRLLCSHPSLMVQGSVFAGMTPRLTSD